MGRIHSFAKSKRGEDMKLIKGYGVIIWGDKWRYPKYISNMYRELDFGKFSIFLGRCKVT
jgi:hypothetical protein